MVSSCAQLLHEHRIAFLHDGLCPVDFPRIAAVPGLDRGRDDLGHVCFLFFFTFVLYEPVHPLIGLGCNTKVSIQLRCPN